MKASALLLCCVALGCHADATTLPSDVQPEDEVWLAPAQLAKAHIAVAEVGVHELAQPIHVSGRVAFDDSRVSHVYSPVTGRVTRVLAKPGQRVTKGAPLLAIRSPDVGTAFADVVKAQADAETAEIDFHREERLLAEDATSQRSKEAAEDAYRRARAEYDRAKQRAALLRAGGMDAVTQNYVLRSYLDGEVIARNVNPGVEVAGQYSGGNAQELVTVGDIKQVWVYADVPDTEMARIAKGADVEIGVLAYPGRTFHGTVDYIATTVDPVLRTAKIRASLPNADEALKPEMLASVAIAQPAQRHLAVPREAVVAINESTFVYVASGARPDARLVFKRRSVTTGDPRDGWVPIVAGVVAGEKIVVQGSITRDQPNDEVWPTPTQLSAGGITTAVATQSRVDQVVTIAGRLTFDDTQISHVFSPVNGRVTRVLAQPGQHVAKGAPLVAIVSPDVGSALADVVKAAADEVQATHEFERQRDLYDAHVGAKRDLEAAEDTLAKAKAEHARAKQLTELLAAGDFNSVSQEYVLRSPIAGEVIARKATPGLEVQGQYANGGSSSNVAELFTIGELRELWAVGDVFEMDLPRVTEGEQVAFAVAGYPGRTFHGRVDWVADVLDPTLHTAKVRCVVENAEGLLKPEMAVAVDVTVPGEAVIAVPRAALMRVDGETVTFVKTGETRPDGGVVFKRRVVTASLDDNTPIVAVRGGLQAGETVAVQHSLMLLGML